ncbi:hypothetical protein CYLTODRAFT_492356 [Cylindrobasidium torrendii FP15055 ss-10]|uniref:F-box domain-containing protein n=1 Tax=Cylindrobasidium torrendii FP15055 ss-10 TaxID=1314674 RepID=A0A0D7B587_9AGAR|nr:hypothetical protein CYLTODRAFT_492356 [Cylindrobasidium torrendii FP15055 ss-10]
MTTEACPLCSFKNAPFPTALDISPRLSQYLDSNAQIDPADSSFIHEDMSCLLEARVELEKRMVAIQNGLNEMMFRKERIDAAIYSRRAVLAPIRLLSDDILGAIFMWCTPSLASDLDETPDSLDVFRWPPWILSHVCRRWRKTALAHKRLWSTIALFLTSYSLTSGSSARLLETALLRAVPCGLDITVDHEAASEFQSHLLFHRHLSEIVKGVTPYIRILHVPTPQISLSLLKDSQLRSLECLQLDYGDRPTDWDEPHIDVPSCEMPRLHTLAYGFAMPSHLDLPWAQLKNISLSCFKVEMLELLADTGLEVLQLERLDYNASHLPQHNAVPCKPLTFPQLHTFWIEGYADELPYFFARVCGPNLKTLKIALYNEDEEPTTLPSVVHHAGRIERLDLALKGAIGLEQEDITNFFRPLSNVRECYIALPLSDLLLLAEDLSANEPILPRLRILRLSADSLRGYIDDLLQVIEVRKHLHNVGKLVAVEITLLVQDQASEWDGDVPSDDARVESVAMLRKMLDCDVRMNTDLDDNAPWSVLPPFASCEMGLDPTLYY